MNPNNGQLIKKRHLAIVSVVLVIIVSLFLFRSGNTKPKVAVEITVVPEDAKILIDGNPSRGGRVKLEAGKHSFTASREGFEDAKNELDIQEDRPVTLLLNPVSKSAREYARKNEDLFLKAESIAGEQARKEGNAFRQANPIVSILPYSGVMFSISYRLEDDNPDKVVVEIEASTSEGRSYALQYMRNKGYDPTNYRIVFNNLPQALVVEN